jgi:hypothetical protein
MVFMANKSLIQLIKQIAFEAVEASKPVVVVYGEVSSTAPLAIYLEQKLTLSDTFLILTDTIKTKTLVTGDKVVMLRMQGGQKYIILDKAVS